MNKRLSYIDATKGLSIIMIMMGHITSVANPLDNWMSSFKVSIFYIISGFLLSYTGSIKKRSFREFTFKLFKNLGIAYISFSALAVIFNVTRDFFKGATGTVMKETFKLCFYDAFFLKGIHALWFLPTLFIGEIIFYFLIRSPLVIKIIYGIAGLFSVTFFVHFIGWLTAHTDKKSFAYIALYRLSYAFGKSFMAAWFLGAGYLIYKYYQKITNTKIKIAIGIGFSAINVFLSRLNEHIDINCLKEGTYPYLYYVCGIIGSIGAIAILDVLSQRFNLKGLSYWGKNSLIVLCTHTALGYKSIILLGWRRYVALPSSFTPRYLIHCTIILIVLMFTVAGIIQFVNSYCPFLIGKPFPKKEKETFPMECK